MSLALPAFILIGIGITAQSNPTNAEDGNAPEVRPGQAAEVSRGGRLYDNHWSVKGRKPPPKRNPAYPTGVADDGLTTWRCVSCHGWDYLGGAGHIGRSMPTFASIRGTVGKVPADIANFLKASPVHAPVLAGLPLGEIDRLALFVCCGQHDIRNLIDDQGKARGDPLRGQDIYENACARCHQPDGKAPLYGEVGDVSSLGWIAKERPAQALHKIRNGVPNADMLSLRFMDPKRLGDLLAYLQTLD